jgi:predicted metalloprotease with PDZ domain
MPDPHTHLFHVEVRVTASESPLELVLPVWTPGSYLVREYARQVQDFEAFGTDGRALAWSKVDKTSWRIAAVPGEAVIARYAAYANELTVRTSHLDATHGYVNPATVFMFVRGREREPLELEIAAPNGWRTTTALAPSGVGEQAGSERFRAADYDELVDSPLEIGTHALLEWEVDGRRHCYAIWGEGNYDGDALVRDTTRIIEAAKELFGELPYPDYTFIVHLVPGGRGGLEHHNSTSLQVDRWTFRGKEYTESFLALVAHEFFHLWNGKRIHPAALGPFDYTAENYTRALWVVEGLTTYYTDLLLVRAGLMTPERYLEKLAESIQRLQAQPGRQVQTLEESSFDTWIKFYRPDENTANAQISYYHKGSLVALLLDLKLRAAQENRRSLDDLMRLLWERYGAPGVGYPESGPGSVPELASEVAGEDLSEFFARYLTSTLELDYAGALAGAGLELVPGMASGADSVETRLGVRLRDEAGRVVITNVLSGGPAERAGLEARDELVAVAGFRASAAHLAARLAERAAGEPLRLSVFRRDQLLERVVVPTAPASPLVIRPVDAPTEAQRAVRSGWLKSSAAA